MLPLIMAALSVGKGIYSAVNANQKKQKNKGYINESYRDASQRLGTRQAGASQGIAESLNARGLAQGGSVTGSPILAAMAGGTTRQQKLPWGGNRSVTVDNNDARMTAAGAPPSTIGGQVASDAAVQMGFERKDLDQQRDRALQENKDTYINSLIHAGTSTAEGLMNARGMSQDMAAMSGKAPGGPPLPALPGPSMMNSRLPAPAPLDRSSVHAAMLSATSYRGVNPVDPLGEETSAWSTHPTPTVLGDGMSNSQFNVG